MGPIIPILIKTLTKLHYSSSNSNIWISNLDFQQLKDFKSFSLCDKKTDDPYTCKTKKHEKI
jgi:hypothetical protein